MKQLIVTCNDCKQLMAFGEEISFVEAKKYRSKLVMNPFGAPRCENKDCKSTEPYGDINLLHTIEIVNYKKDRELFKTFSKNN